MRRATRGTALACAVGLALLGGCGEAAEPTADVAPAADFGHVHAVVENPGDGAVYVAAHTGVFRLDGGVPERVAGRWQDTMALTVLGPDHFLASGHPDLREDLPSHLGLVESKDAARTWRPVSLGGEADFHALEEVDGRVYGLDSVSGGLLVTEDLRSWSRVAPVPAYDIAVDPSGTGTVLLTDPHGAVLLVAEEDPQPRRLTDAPALQVLDWTADDGIVGVDGRGQVYRYAGAGSTWEELAPLGSPPQALSLGEEAWYAAVEGAVLASEDDGATWSTLARG